ncbi:MAG: hypothetical protein KAR62_06980 [Sphingomonadales bacterium]|nr:hypothetical protein [Sphingomonadales bacterium]
MDTYVQIISSLVAVLFLFYLNKKLGVYITARFKDEKMATEVIKKDFPDNKNLKLGQLLFLDSTTALFEYIDSDKERADVFGLSQALGDNFVNRQLATTLLTSSANNITASGNKYCLTLSPKDMTLPPTKIQFNDTDTLYYWLLEQNISFPALKTNNKELANATT